MITENKNFIYIFFIVENFFCGYLRMDLIFSPFYRILANHNLITIFLKPFAVLSGVLKQLGFVMFFYHSRNKVTRIVEH